MNKTVMKARMRRKKRVRSQIVGKTSLPRLSIFRSNKYIYAQVISDIEGKTIIAKSDIKKSKESIPEQTLLMPTLKSPTPSTGPPVLLT